MKKLLRYLFTPHSHNNHRPKILHHSYIFVIILSILFLTVTFSFFKTTHPQILGVSYSIVEDELLMLTNNERQKLGLTPLTLNPQLRQAANSKATHMFSKNYWAHFAPDGTSPWYFIRSSGYKYEYAGENLAKGFTNSKEVVKAWMESPTHRENMLSKNYTDIGFAVSEGRLEGEDTVLVVEMLGSQIGSEALARNEDSREAQVVAQIPDTGVNEVSNVKSEQRTVYDTVAINRPVIDIVAVPRMLLISLFALLLGVLALDFMIIHKKQLPRIVGHNLDHIMLITLFLLFILLARQGVTQ